jgi:ABC-type Na+ efflux pump permease subunit
MKKVLIIIKREYLVRVRTRAFMIGTIISPVLLLALIILPGFLAERGSGGERRITVLDQSGDPKLFDAINERVASRPSDFRWMMEAWAGLRGLCSHKDCFAGSG